MIFDMTANANGRKLPTLNPDYPLDQTVTFIQGNTVSAVFEARIAKDGRPTQYSYQWYLDGEAVSGATDSSFQFNGISSSGNHALYCVITNAAGSVQTRTATLTADMYYTPVLNTSYPSDATVEVGKSATFSVSIATAGNPASYTYQWYKNGSAVSGATSSSYTYTPTEIGSTTVYCIVTNAAGNVQSRTATLTAKVAPQYLYSAGQTSGFTARGKKVSSSSYNPDTPTLNYNSSNMTCEISTSYREGMCYYSDMVNLADYSTLHFTGSSNGNTKICIWSSIGTYLYNNVVSSISFTGNTTLDVSSLTGSYYIGFAIESQSTSRKVTCTGLYLT